MIKILFCPSRHNVVYFFCWNLLNLMAVETLINFLKKFWTITNLKFIFVKLKSASVLTWPTFFYCNYNESYYLFYLLTTDFMTSRTRVFIIIFKILYIFLYILYKICSPLKFYHLNRILIVLSDSKKAFSGSWIKFVEKSLWFKWLRHFLTLFHWIWFLPAFVVVFIIISLISKSYWWP